MNLGEPSPNPVEMADLFRLCGPEWPDPSWNMVNIPIRFVKASKKPFFLEKNQNTNPFPDPEMNLQEIF